MKCRKQNPDKIFIPAPPNDSTCACNECNFMAVKHDGPENYITALNIEQPEITVDAEVREKAVHCLFRECSKFPAKLGL